ncbi:dynein regulatory complex subunit 2-like isoform X2 [Coccinella septempunctata]|uniref:dynein regulatory complex subunit 2-like isoform X2 n=1 Tax=Coccinella septempunctata TaxID=41139 RepID=UPI001D064C77|nr:dynein regulatory complex subunit 2-like isoform X2 [Coccinella septempunctata]
MSKNRAANKANIAKQIKLAELRREVNYSKYNLTRAEKEWKQICVNITLPKLREELINCWHYFEKVVDTKDFVISYCMDEVRYHEDIYNLNLQNHQDHIQKLMIGFAQALQEIHHENNEYLMNLIQKSLEDWENQMGQAYQSENYMKVMKFGLEVLSKRWDKMCKTESFARLNEESSKHVQEIQQLSFILELKLEELWDKIRLAEDDYWQRIQENKKHHDVIKEIDDATTRTVQKELKKLMKLQVVAKRLASKFKELVGSIGKKLKYLQQEKESLLELQFALRNKLMQDKDNDYLKRTLITVEFGKAFDYLNDRLKKGERMMMVLKGGRRYETSQGKILPYPVRFCGSDGGHNYTIPELRLFWQRMANAEAYRHTLNEERKYLENENNKIRKQIHSFCKCLDCPPLPHIPQRAGKIPYTEGREMVQKQKAQNGKRGAVGKNMPSV